MIWVEIANSKQRSKRMRLYLAATSLALTTAAFVTTPALSQVDGFGHPIKPKQEYHQPPRNEGAYRDALDKIPEQKSKVDPWQTVRDKPATPSK
jgi:hypothetical protein